MASLIWFYFDFGLRHVDILGVLARFYGLIHVWSSLKVKIVHVNVVKKYFFDTCRDLILNLSFCLFSCICTIHIIYLYYGNNLNEGWWMMVCRTHQVEGRIVFPDPWGWRGLRNPWWPPSSDTGRCQLHWRKRLTEEGPACLTRGRTHSCRRHKHTHSDKLFIVYSVVDVLTGE